jgi:hypothetical protein
LKEEDILKVTENKVHRRISGPVRDEVTGGWIRQYSEELTVCTLHQVLLGWSNIGGCDRLGS